jgi:hypothetical protein
MSRRFFWMEEIMRLRKRIVPAESQGDGPEWLSLEDVAEVEVSSEDPDFPVDGALMRNSTRGWRAAHQGAQTLRIRFDTPQPLSLIHVVFEESECERIQEFALQYSSDRGLTFQPVVRQQFTFSPAGATREEEKYVVSLAGVTDLELQVLPDVSGRPVVATLRSLRLR